MAQERAREPLVGSVSKFPVSCLSSTDRQIVVMRVAPAVPDECRIDEAARHSGFLEDTANGHRAVRTVRPGPCPGLTDHNRLVIEQALHANAKSLSILLAEMRAVQSTEIENPGLSGRHADTETEQETGCQNQS